MALIPTLVQVIISIILDLNFKAVANKATEIENHRTQTDFNNSLIIKRFAFMFCDYFLYLFYIGIYELRIDLLRTNLGFLFMIDEIRRITIETIIPAVAMWSAKRKTAKDEAKKDKNSKEYIEAKENEEVEKGEYETFDDYLEMIITFGYVTLFAAAFPLASFISMIFIYFEARSDLYKLEKLVKRPRVKKAYNIGSWIYVLEFMAITSIFTNIILFTFASDQIDHLLPFLARYRNDSVQSVATMFTIEHAMILLVIILRVFLDKDPAWVSLYKQRRAYQKEQKTLKKQAEAKAAIFTAKLTTQLFKKQTTLLSEGGASSKKASAGSGSKKDN